MKIFFGRKYFHVHLNMLRRKASLKRTNYYLLFNFMKRTNYYLLFIFISSYSSSLNCLLHSFLLLFSRQKFRFLSSDCFSYFLFFSFPHYLPSSHFQLQSKMQKQKVSPLDKTNRKEQIFIPKWHSQKGTKRNLNLMFNFKKLN